MGGYTRLELVAATRDALAPCLAPEPHWTALLDANLVASARLRREFLRPSTLSLFDRATLAEFRFVAPYLLPWAAPQHARAGDWQEEIWREIYLGNGLLLGSPLPPEKLARGLKIFLRQYDVGLVEFNKFYNAVNLHFFLAGDPGFTDIFRTATTIVAREFRRRADFVVLRAMAEAA